MCRPGPDSSPLRSSPAADCSDATPRRRPSSSARPSWYSLSSGGAVAQRPLERRARDAVSLRRRRRRRASPIGGRRRRADVDTSLPSDRDLVAILGPWVEAPQASRRRVRRDRIRRLTARPRGVRAPTISARRRAEDAGPDPAQDLPSDEARAICRRSEPAVAQLIAASPVRAATRERDSNRARCASIAPNRRFAVRQRPDVARGDTLTHRDGFAAQLLGAICGGSWGFGVGGRGGGGRGRGAVWGLLDSGRR